MAKTKVLAITVALLRLRSIASSLGLLAGAPLAGPGAAGGSPHTAHLRSSHAWVRLCNRVT